MDRLPGMYLHELLSNAYIDLTSDCVNSLHTMHLYIGAHVTEVNCGADRFLERHWILFPAVFSSGCGLHT